MKQTNKNEFLERERYHQFVDDYTQNSGVCIASGDTLFCDNGTLYRIPNHYTKFRQLKTEKTNGGGYVITTVNGQHPYVHRIIWEVFNGEIPKNYEIDHINTIRTDNRLSNLRCCTTRENHNNPLSREHYQASNKINGLKGRYSQLKTRYKQLKQENEELRKQLQLVTNN